MDPNEKKPAAASKIKWFQWSWWMITILAIVAIALVLSVVVWLMPKSNKSQDTVAKVDTTQEITIKQHMSSLRGDIVRYYETNKTYVGWKASEATVNQVKTMGSELKTQALTQDTYVIFAKMPTSKLIFCMDDKGFTGEIKSLSGRAKSCQ